MDGTGLYYYGARYYDPEIGRFISADTVVQDYNNPQTLNRYAYVLNNPLKYNDPTGRVSAPADDLGLEPTPSPDSTPPDPTPLDPTPTTPQPALPPELDEDGIEVGEIIFDATGQLWTSWNTDLGLILGAMSGDSSFRPGPRGTIIIEGVDPDSITGQLMDSVLGNTIAFTVGYVILTTKPNLGDVEEHELGHVTQAAVLGPLYLPAYGLGWLGWGRFDHDLNPMEKKWLPAWP